MAPHLSILIVNWNTRQLVLDCLRSLRSAALALPHEIVVVDNASHDGSAAAIAGEFPEVVLIRNGENVGFAAANNQAMRASRGVYLLLLNSDTLVASGQLEGLVAFMEARPRCGIAGPKLLNADGSFQLSALRFIEPADLFYEHARFPRHLQPLAQRAPRRIYHPDPRIPREEAHEVDYVLGAALLIRRAVIDQIGGMDEGYFMYAEELDWCFRAKQAGHEVWFVPEFAITHLGGQSTAQVPDRMLAYRFASSLRFLARHGGPAKLHRARRLLQWAALQNIALLALRALAGREGVAAFRHGWRANWVVFRTAWRNAVPPGLT